MAKEADPFGTWSYPLSLASWVVDDLLVRSFSSPGSSLVWELRSKSGIPLKSPDPMSGLLLLCRSWWRLWSCPSSTRTGSRPWGYGRQRASSAMGRRGQGRRSSPGMGDWWGEGREGLVKMLIPVLPRMWEGKGRAGRRRSWSSLWEGLTCLHPNPDTWGCGCPPGFSISPRELKCSFLHIITTLNTHCDDNTHHSGPWLPRPTPLSSSWQDPSWSRCSSGTGPRWCGMPLRWPRRRRHASSSSVRGMREVWHGMLVNR